MAQAVTTEPSPQDLKPSALSPDGKRRMIHPADVQGRFTKRRKILFFLLIAFYAVLPWITIGGHPAIFLDLPRRQFFLFGGSFNAQDAWLTIFFLALFGLALVVTTTLFGRLWCGYACPQTVFLEGLYRRVERWIDGPANARRKLAQAPWDRVKILKRVAKHGLFLLISFLVAHIFLGYFISIPRLFAMMGKGPGENPQAFLIAFGATGIMYFNFAWFREQFCVVLCPYGRLQSVLTDSHTMIIGYEARRGEPRVKLKTLNGGDCVDCGRCVAVCPTGIDIRNGSQLECIGCAGCIDACDEVMQKVGRAPGLIRYDSARALSGQPSRMLRPRLFIYAGVFLLVGVSAVVAITGRSTIEADLVRLKGDPYTVQSGLVTNQFELRIVNKSDAPQIAHVHFVLPDAISANPDVKQVSLMGLSNVVLPISFSGQAQSIARHSQIQVEISVGSDTVKTSSTFLGPTRAP